MNPSDTVKFVSLLRNTRWAALASVGEGGPLASMVAYAPVEDMSGFLLHLSGLARHTSNLLAAGVASLAITETDPGGGDPQTLARVTVSGSVRAVPRDAPEYPPLRDRYLARLPAAEPLFGFEDFGLFLLEPREVNYVGGFARAYTLNTEKFLAEVRKADRLQGAALTAEARRTQSRED